MIVVIQQETQLRVYEEKNLDLVFGGVRICLPEQAIKTVRETGAKYVYWRPDTENTTAEQWSRACGIAEVLDVMSVKAINPVQHFQCAQNKADCFRAWYGQVPIPEWFTFRDATECGRWLWQPPYLLRLSNSNTGQNSLLVQRPEDLAPALAQVLEWGKDPPYHGGIRTDMLAVKFHSTVGIYSCNYSYRIIVAGDEVITGYARVSRYEPTNPDSWVAITGQFEESLGEAWIHYNEQCGRFCVEHKDELVRALRCLGLNFQGVDVIIDAATKKPLYLEIQPGFAVGYFNHPGWKAPYYNPSQPAVVQFINEHMDELRRRIPCYVSHWLDKDRMFHESFTAIKAELDKE